MNTMRYIRILRHNGFDEARGSRTDPRRRYALLFAFLLALQAILPVRAATDLGVGEHYACALVAGGKIMCWGNNVYGQLGDGSGVKVQPQPTRASGIENAVVVATSYGHSCAVLSDGTVKCWGLNNYGQLGLGDTSNRSIPTVVSGLSGVRSISLGDLHSCALLNTGEVKCWGNNASQQLGNPALPPEGASTPQAVPGLSGVLQISAGTYHTCALHAGGNAVSCWGSNSSGQLGDGSTNGGWAQVSQLNNVGIREVGAGSSSSCAVRNDGRVMCWGSNSVGQLGDGSTTDHLLPEVVPTLAGVSHVSVGDNHVCAQQDSGLVRCWGDNSTGQLGDGTTTQRLSPVLVQGVSDATTVATSLHMMGGTSCARLRDGTIRCWGSNGLGVTGSGIALHQPAAARVAGMTEAVNIALGADHSCARLATNGRVKCWGKNDRGQLGTGNTADTSLPTDVTSMSNAINVGAGAATSCAALGAAGAMCWGANAYGQLGNNSTSDSLVPVPVTNLANTIDVQSGVNHSCALLSTGKVMCWGASPDGQLGNGAPGSNSLIPVEVLNISTATQIAVGDNHSCARLGSGKIMCWGHGYSGQIGNGFIGAFSIPEEVLNISTATAVAAGARHTCALLADKSVQCWGDNFQWQLGNIMVPDSATPVPVPGLPAADEIGLGSNHSCAVATNGKAYCWGSNNDGQIGNLGTTFDLKTTAQQVDNLYGAVTIAGGKGHSCATLTSGAMKCWGTGGGGQLGNGALWNHLSPTRAEVPAYTGRIFADGIEDIVTGRLDQLVRDDADGSAWGFVRQNWGVPSDGPDFDIYLFESDDDAKLLMFIALPAPVGVVLGDDGKAAPLHSGDTIGPGASFSNFNHIQLDHWHSGITAHIGIAFRHPNTLQIHYGYLELETNGPDGFPARVKRWGYNQKPGAPITIP